MRRLEEQAHGEGVFGYLLAPALSPEQSRGELYELVVLAAVCRLSRGRPHAVVCVDEQAFAQRSPAEDVRYFYSLPSLGEHQSLRSIEGGDTSPFIPRSEDEFLLLLAAPPPPVLPSWPRTILDLNAIFITQVDEFVKVQTADPEAIDLLESVPVLR
jgi:hypothetical protein